MVLCRRLLEREKQVKMYQRVADGVLRWLTEPRNANTSDRVVWLWLFTMGLLCVQILASVVF